MNMTLRSVSHTLFINYNNILLTQILMYLRDYKMLCVSSEFLY